MEALKHRCHAYKLQDGVYREDAGANYIHCPTLHWHEQKYDCRQGNKAIEGRCQINSRAFFKIKPLDIEKQTQPKDG
jgi:hypothetical protein